MKLIIALLVLSLVEVQASVYSQSKKFTFDLHGKPIREVLKTIEQNSKFKFFYNEDFINVDKVVDLSVQESRVEEVLDQVLANTGISYQVLDNDLIVLTQRQNSNDEPKSQGIKITGRITESSSGEPVPGAIVSIKGTNKAVVADAEGKFRIEAAGANDVLVVSMLGYVKKEIPVDNTTDFSITLEPEVTAMDEVVVIGYGVVKRSDLTGAVATVKGENLIKKPSSNVEQLLQGRVPGMLIVTPSGEPGSSATVTIRGESSLRASSDPLVVVDGFPWGSMGNLKQLNPDDIESIEVLKDASSTAIYGSKGANGVIMITTKKGKEGFSNISFSTIQSYSTPSTEYDVWKDPVMYAIIDNEARRNGGVSEANLYFVGHEIEGHYYPSVEELRGIDPNRPKWPYKTYWPDVVYRNPYTQSYTLSITSGNKDTKFYISGNYYHEEGLAIENYLEKYTVRTAVDHRVYKWLVTGVNVNVNNTFSNGGNLSANRAPVWPVYDSTGNYYRLNERDFSPLSQACDVLNQNRTLDLFSLAYVEGSITDWLKIKSQLNYKFGNSVGDYYAGRDAAYNGWESNGVGSKSIWQQNNLISETYINANKAIGDHQFGVIAGFTRETNRVRNNSMSGTQFPNDNLKNENLNNAQNQIIGNTIGNNYNEALNSYYGRLTYNYKNKYLLTFTYRADGSSKFGENNKWGYFPSGAIAWKAHEEEFLKNVNILSELKLRLSHGLSGVQAIGPYETLDRYGSQKYFLDGTFKTGFGPGIYYYSYINKYWKGLPNPDLKWETTRQTDVGIDIGFLKQRITASIDIYYKETKDLLRDRKLPPSSAYDYVTVNDGKLENKGIDGSVDVKIISNSEMQWNVGGTFSVNRNKILSMGESDTVQIGESLELTRAPINYLIVGQPKNVFLGYKTAGIIQKGEDLSYLRGDINPKPGEIHYLDISGPNGVPDSVIDAYDRTIIGNPNPDFILSFYSSFRYKKFDASISLYGVFGNDIFDLQKWSPSRQVQRWTPDNPSKEFPSVNSTRIYYASDWFVEDGSFLRVQNITVGYNFDIRAAHAKLRTYFSVANLYTFTHFHKGFDPEVNANGQNRALDGSQYSNPLYAKPRTYSLGLELNF